MAQLAPGYTLVYSSPVQQLEVYKVQGTDGTLSCLRIQHFHSFEDCQMGLERFQLQQTLIHDCICKGYNASMEEEAGEWVLRVELEWCGRDLDSLTRTEHAQGWAQESCGQLLNQVVWALAYAQEKEVCHRDIKPSNLFLSDSGLFKIADFGCAKAFNSSVLGHTMAGTPLYLSPILRKAFTKVVLGEETGEVEHNPYKSDVYSLGLTLISLLKPASKSILGNQSEIMKTIPCLPIQISFQDTLRLMLELEEANRPDFIALTAHLQALSAPSLIGQPSVPLSAVPVQEPPSGQKRKLRIIKKPQPSVQSAPASTSSALASASQSHCLVCLRDFIINPTDDWRLELIGSSYSQKARNYCSLSCFQRGSQQQPVLASRDSEGSPELEEGPRIHCVLVLNPRAAEPPEEQFLHCFKHTGELPLRGDIMRSTPTILAQCPECFTGELTRISLPQVNKWVVQNSLYESLVFIESRHYDATAYLLLSEKVLPALHAGICHFCSSSVNPINWMGLLHNNNLALVCSPDCLLRASRYANCPACEAPLQANIRDCFPPSGSYVIPGDENDVSCCLCKCDENNYILGCGHGFCRRCLAYIPTLDIPVFSCLFCGKIQSKEDYPDLF